MKSPFGIKIKFKIFLLQSNYLNSWMLNKISGSKVGVNLYDSWINPTVTWVNAHKECISLHNPSLLTIGQVSFFGLTGSHWLLWLLKAVNAWKDPFQRIIAPKSDNKASAEIFGNPLKRIQQRRRMISFWQKNLRQPSTYYKWKLMAEEPL